MKIVSLAKVGEPFVGIIEKENGYLSFIFSSQNNGYHELSIYPKSDYPSYEHFVAYISNYRSLGTCLKKPIEIKSISENELFRVHRTIKSLYFPFLKRHPSI